MINYVPVTSFFALKNVKFEVCYPLYKSFLVFMSEQT